MTAPHRLTVIEQLESYVDQYGIQPDPEFAGWKSGVYAVLDCVFSSMADYETMVLPALKRFGERTELRDESGLTFSRFIQDVNAHLAGPGSFTSYAREKLDNCQQIAGRTKLEVSYDVCKFFVDRGHETMASLQALPQGQPGTCDTPPGEPGQLERWVLDDIIRSGSCEKIRGMGPALGAYLLMNLGNEEYVKVDTMIRRVFADLGEWRPRAGRPEDDALIRDAITCIARRMDTTPRRLDNALWKRESDRAKAKKTSKTAR